VEYRGEIWLSLNGFAGLFLLAGIGRVQLTTFDGKVGAEPKAWPFVPWLS